MKIIKTAVIIEVETALSEEEVNVVVEKALQDTGITVVGFDDFEEGEEEED
ncbi:MAG: hypothetical protein PHY15_06755 [Eubacteriales bacterium]|nr:hypothetical protein [Eubacteriales bacterium]